MRYPTLCAVPALLSFLLAPLPAQDSFTFRGRVTDGRGQPVVGAGILVGTTEDVVTSAALERPTLRADADGRFTITLPAAELLPGNGPARCALIAAPGKVALEQPLMAAWLIAMQMHHDLELGDLVLDEGTTLKGRVRQTDGKPLAGARVAAHDLLPRGRGQSWLTESRARTLSYATTGADGTFVLPGVYASAVEVVADAPGFYRQHLLPVTDRDPLLLELAPGGLVRGTVVDADGKPAVATVRLRSEVHHEAQELRTGADGGFALPLRYRGRYRVQAIQRGTRGLGLFQDPTVLGESEVQSGPAEGLRIQRRAAHPGTLRVRARDQGGQPILAFVAEVTWSDGESNLVSLGALEDPDAVAADAEGVARLPGPLAPEQTPKGLLRVRADGYVALLKKDLQWTEDGQECVCTLEPEATLAGTVLDAATQAPLAGAEVRLQLPPGGDQEQRMLSLFNLARVGRVLRTGADGSFRFRGLGRGRYLVFAQAPGRPEARGVPVVLEAREQRRDLRLPLAQGATLRGTLTGGPLPAGARVVRLLEPGMLDRIGLILTSVAFGGSMVTPGANAVVAADGSFRLEGLPPGLLDLGLLTSSSPRYGASVQSKFDAVRLDPGEVLQEEYDVTRALPGTVAGRLVVLGHPQVARRLCVWATTAGAQGALDFFGNDDDARRAVADAEGRFAVLVPPGTTRLRVVDVATGVEFAHEEVKVNPGQRVEQTLTVTAVKVRLRLGDPAAALVAAERLVIVPPQQEAQGLAALFLGGGEEGLPLWAGARELDVFVPPGSHTFRVLGGGGRLQGAQAWTEAEVLGELEHDVRAEEPPVLTVPLEAPRR